MARKAKIEVLIDDKLTEVDGYEVNPKLGLCRLEKTGTWKCVHLSTGIRISGEYDKFKQKRDCLLFTELLAQEPINWNFKTKEEAKASCLCLLFLKLPKQWKESAKI